MIIYREATKDDMLNVAKTHIQCFKGFFLSSLGKDLLEKLYMEYLEVNQMFYVAENTENGEIVAFCVGHYYGDPARANFEKKYKKQLTHRLFILCLKLDKNAIIRCAEKIKSVLCKKVKSHKSEPKIDKQIVGLLSIGVLESYRGDIGVSADLLNYFETKIKEKGIKKYSLTVHKVNIRAQKFYEKHALIKKGEYNKSYIYEKNLI